MPRKPARPRIIHEPLVKGIVRTPVKSSNILSVGYAEGVMEIEYTDASVYQYPDQSKSKYDVLMRVAELVDQGMAGASVGKTLIAMGLRSSPSLLIAKRSKITGLIETFKDGQDPALMPVSD